MLNTSNLNESKISLIEYNRDIIDMDLGKIKEFIKLLEDHRLKCETGERFKEAEIAKLRVLQFKEIEKKKIFRELRKSQDEKKEIIKEDQESELEEFDEKWNKTFNDLENNYNVQMSLLKKKHENQEKSRKIEFFDNNNKETRLTSQIINLIDIREGIIKQLDYNKANDIQNRINELKKKEYSKNKKESEANWNKEILRLNISHEKELNVMKQKMKCQVESLMKQKEKEYQNIIQKYKNKTQNYKVEQSKEKIQISRQLKSISRLNPSKKPRRSSV